ncbi:MAG: hypothetical protein JW788_03810 [Candidatus Omnitrophica bacterium]|nr:hypothetical protein [Candidatus Omnitrophota bacterium]
MADEVKKEEKVDAKKVFGTILKVALGLVFLVLGVYLGMRWRFHLLHVIQGCIGLFLVLCGIITLAIAKE